MSGRYCTVQWDGQLNQFNQSLSNWEDNVKWSHKDMEYRVCNGCEEKGKFATCKFIQIMKVWIYPTS